MRDERQRDREEFFVVVAWSCSLLQRVKNVAVMTIHGFEEGGKHEDAG